MGKFAGEFQMKRTRNKLSLKIFRNPLAIKSWHLKKPVLLLWAIAAFVIVQARAAGPIDSAMNVQQVRASNMRLGMRLHSMGQFAYGGRVVSDNPVVDFNFTYDRKNWGLQIFKAWDLRDLRTDINFALAVVNKNIHLGKRLTLTPSAGFILEQNKSIADHGSDVVFILTSSYKLGNGFALEHSALFGNLVLEPHEHDWVNRFRFLYSKKHLDLALLCWHNNQVLDRTEYATLGLSTFISRIKVSKVVTLNGGVTGLFMPYSNDTAEYPKRNGVVLTLGAIVD